MAKRKVIFVVEDDPGFNMMMTSYLTAKNKWDVYSFHSGEESLERLDLKPTIFLQDIDLPGMNGIEVMKQVKLRAPEIEFIFLSAQTNLKIVVDTLQLGGFDYIVKDNYAKENALNKIDQVVKILNFLEKERTDKKSKMALYILLITFIVVFVLYFVWISLK